MEHMNTPNDPQRVTWPYVVLVVLLAAIGNGWSASDLRTLGYTLVALVSVGCWALRRE